MIKHYVVFHHRIPGGRTTYFVQHNLYSWIHEVLIVSKELFFCVNRKGKKGIPAQQFIVMDIPSFSMYGEHILLIAVFSLF